MLRSTIQNRIDSSSKESPNIFRDIRDVPIRCVTSNILLHVCIKYLYSVSIFGKYTGLTAVGFRYIVQYFTIPSMTYTTIRHKFHIQQNRKDSQPVIVIIIMHDCKDYGIYISICYPSIASKNIVQHFQLIVDNVVHSLKSPTFQVLIKR